MQADELGIVTALQARRMRFAERHPALRRHFAGKGPDVSNAKETHITVDIPSGQRAISAGISQRDLQKAVNKRAAELVAAEIERQAARRAAEQVALLAETKPIARTGAVTIRDIMEAVSLATGFSVDELCGPRRYRSVARARHIAYWLMRELRPDLSLPAIGRAVGRRDHTTIISGINRFHVVRDTAPTNAWLQHPAVAALADRISK